MKISEWVVHQIAHFFTTATLMMWFARRVPIIVILGAIVVVSAIKEFVFDRRINKATLQPIQDLQGRWEDFVFLCLGGLISAVVIYYVPLYG